jgi:two-component system, LytTR family, response regulator LytT
MKNLKINKPIYHILYWLLIMCVLVLIFGRSWDDNVVAFYFISLLLPVIIATSYFFNYFLVPRYLLTKRYFLFGLYFFYLIIVSLFLEMLVVTFTFIMMVQFHYDKISPVASDALTLGMVMYLIVFLGSFILMVAQLRVRLTEIDHLKERNKKFQKSFLQVTSQRKSVKIPYEEIDYIESLSDYIKICCSTNQPISSKTKISQIEIELPENFLRIHRSFIINIEKISSFNYNEVMVNEMLLNIGRTYKKEVLRKLKEKD